MAESADGIIREWREDLRVSLAGLTRAPVGRDNDGPENEARAVRANALVGAVIGLIGAVVYALAYWSGTGVWPAALLAVGATALVTGAVHENGLLRACTREPGDREAGTPAPPAREAAGLLVLLIATMLKVGALAALVTPGAVAAALIAAHALARGVLPGFILWCGFGRVSHASERPRPTAGQAGIALALGAAVALLFLGPLAGLRALLVTALALLVVGIVGSRDDGEEPGTTGDGAEQVAEIAVLLSA